MHNKPHTEEAKKKIRESQKRWRSSPEYQDFIERQRERARKSKTKFKKGHKPHTDGLNLLGLQAGENHWKWNGGEIIQLGYRLIWSPDHPERSKRNYVMEHRLVMEKEIGRYLTKDEIVHHINGDKLDNRIENLQIMTRSEHTTHHLKERYANAKKS